MKKEGENRETEVPLAMTRSLSKSSPPMRTEQHQRQGQLLLVSLLEVSFSCKTHSKNFCALYEQSPEKNNALFLEICKRLSFLGIIQSEDVMDEMSSVRSTYKRAFRELVVTALKEIKKPRRLGQRRASPHSTDDDEVSEESETVKRMASLMVKKSKQMLADPPTHSFALEVSRFHDEFEELGPLGVGAFGQVWKAKNKLDGMEYAIKKVRLKNAKTVGFQKILREVKYLARLQHPNVVRYFSSWIEHGVWKPFPQGDEQDHPTYSSYATIESIHTTREETSRTQFNQNSQIHQESHLQQTTTVITRSASQESITLPIYSQELVLYIQMEICGENLFEWIANRNARLDLKTETVDMIQCHNIFLDIVYGLEYIHSKGCIHRDLKPHNIYKRFAPTVENDTLGQWKLGDFGLATSMDRRNVFYSETNHCESESAESVSLGIGTFTYASPEQLSDSLDTTYTTQSDIYSLGIIFFELAHPFGTAMERAYALTNLRQGVLPDDFVIKFPKEATLVLWLMSEDPTNRPTASQLLDFELLRAGKPRESPHNLSTVSLDSSVETPELEVTRLVQENQSLKHRIITLETIIQNAGLSHLL